MMKAADFRNRDDRLSGCCRDWSRIWRVLLEPKMGPSLMIVPAVDREDASHDEQLQHAMIVAGVGAKFNSDEFWRGSGTSLARVAVSSYLLRFIGWDRHP
jgi:hypothetical protein